MKMKTLALACMCAMLASCSALKVDRLPCFEKCQTLHSPPDVRLAWVGDVATREMPLMVPFALGSTPQVRSPAALLDLAEKGRAMKADLILLDHGAIGRETAIVLNNGIAGLPISYDTRQVDAVFYRLSPVDLGLTLDAGAVVLAVSSVARERGLLEGDRVISISGAAVTTGQHAMRSDHFSKLLDMRVGDEIEIAWIRPGTGRQSGKIVCQPNPPKHMDFPDALRAAEDEWADRANYNE